MGCVSSGGGRWPTLVGPADGPASELRGAGIGDGGGGPSEQGYHHGSGRKRRSIGYRRSLNMHASGSGQEIFWISGDGRPRSDQAESRIQTTHVQ